MEEIERMWGPLKYEPLSWCDKIFFLCRVPSLPLARNILASEGLKSDADWFLWVDSDHVMESPENPNEALHMLWQCLIETGENIATGLYRAKQKHGFNYAIWKAVPQDLLAKQSKALLEEALKEDDEEKYNEALIKLERKEGYVHIDGWEGNWFTVDVCGAGFMLMHRRVLEAIEELNRLYDGEFYHWESPEAQSEDFNLLSKCRAAGFKIWCFSEVRLWHRGDVFLSTNNVVLNDVECPHCKNKFNIDTGVPIIRTPSV